ncbi:hypothetical protein MVEN_00489000 [Mycena venus]|uniref:Uncharacterized protein n=1 Tax=Mycena venus TaxID=2733690 RepID=A0A8H6YVS3_9AGAR|nr:hypothetical protein MVEN_00489000 [Mycena venus]
MGPKPQPKLTSQSTKAKPTTAFGMSLRADRTLNPGLPNMPRPMRSSAEVQQEKRTKAQQHQQKEDKRREGISRAAAVENRMVMEDSVRDQNANHPPPSGLEKVLRPCPEKAAVEEEPIAEGTVVDPCSDGPGSSDDYQPPAKAHSESDEEVMDASDDEALPQSIKSAGRIKKAPKGSTRHAVDAERVKQGGSLAEGKRKAPLVEQVILFCCQTDLLTCRRSNPKKKQKKANLGGIQIDWSCGRTPAVENTPAPSRSRSTSSGVMSFISHRRAASSDADVPPGSDSSVMGGIQSDANDGDERDYAVKVTENAVFARAKVTSIAGIVETNAPGLVAPSARRQGCDKIKKADIKLTDIPDEIRSQFKTRFTPPLLSFVGTIHRWEDPSIDDVIQIWSDVFPDYAVSTEDPHDNQLVLVITKLAQDKVDGWRNKLGTAGVAVWKQKFLGMSKEKIVKEVEGYLAGSDRSRVFYYCDVERDDTTGNIKYKGMFQNPAFSRLIGIHCLATTVDGELSPLAFDPNNPSTYPEGALKRGLNYFRTGELVIPPGSNGKFSKTNWADRVDFSEGVRKVIPSTSTIAAVIGKLKPAHWTKIIAAAQAATLQRDDTPAVAVIDVDADPVEEDFDLVDDDSDA